MSFGMNTYSQTQSKGISNLVATWLWVDYVIIKFTIDWDPKPARHREIHLTSSKNSMFLGNADFNESPFVDLTTVRNFLCSFREPVTLSCP